MKNKILKQFIATILIFILILIIVKSNASAELLSYKEIFYKNDLSKLENILKKYMTKDMKLIKKSNDSFTFKGCSEKIVRKKMLRWAKYELSISLITDKRETMLPIILLKSRVKKKEDKFFSEIFKITDEIKIYKKIQIACLDNEKDRISPTRHDRYLTIVKLESSIYLKIDLKTTSWYRNSFPPEVNIVYPILMRFLNKKDYYTYYKYETGVDLRETDKLIEFTLVDKKLKRKNSPYKPGWKDNLMILSTPKLTGEITIGSFNLKIANRDMILFQDKIKKILEQKKYKISKSKDIVLLGLKSKIWFFTKDNKIGFLTAIKEKRKYPFIIEGMFKTKKLFDVEEIAKDILKSIKRK